MLTPDRLALHCASVVKVQSELLKGDHDPASAEQNVVVRAPNTSATVCLMCDGIASVGNWSGERREHPSG